MALTKSTGERDAWEEVGQNSVREGTWEDFSGCYAAELHIDVALSSTTPHTGTEVIVQIGTDTGDKEDNVTNWVRYTCCVGTAVTLELASNEDAGQTVLDATNPVTANMDNDGKFKFIENKTTPANSEIVYQTANSGDSGDTITILDGLSHNQIGTSSSKSAFFDIDHATTEAVSMQTIKLPFECDRARVLINNKYDDNGSTVYSRTRYTKVTAV